MHLTLLAIIILLCIRIYLLAVELEIFPPVDYM